MPLTPGSSNAVKSENISELMHTGKYPQRQAIAIALSNARRHPGRAEGGTVPPVNFAYTPPSGPTQMRRLPIGTAAVGHGNSEEPNPEVTGTLGTGHDANALQVMYRKNIPFADGGGITPRRSYDPQPVGLPFAKGGLPSAHLPNLGAISHIKAPTAPHGMNEDTPQIPYFERQEIRGMKAGGAVSTAAIDKAVNSASRAAKKHLNQHFDAGGATPEIPYFERQEARDISGVHPGGLVASAVPGRTDMHNVNVAAGSYVLPADVVSGLGEGNTLAGAKVVDAMLSSGPWGTRLPSIRHGGGYGAIPRPPRPFTDEDPSAVRASPSDFAARGGAEGSTGKPIPIVVAGGEIIIRPDQVTRIGAGDIHRGHAVLDRFVLHVRKKTADTLKHLPGPVR